MLSQNNNHLISKNGNLWGISPIKTFTVCTAAIIVFGVFGCDRSRFSENRAKYMEQNINKIKIGMTKQELKSVLGEPDDYIPKSNSFNAGGSEKATVWLYLYPDDHMSHHIEFDNRTDKIIKSKKESTGLF
jgi:hypothetical protein